MHEIPAAGVSRKNPDRVAFELLEFDGTESRHAAEHDQAAADGVPDSGGSNSGGGRQLDPGAVGIGVNPDREGQQKSAGENGGCSVVGLAQSRLLRPASTMLPDQMGSISVYLVQPR